jgi:hypothetical protein
MASVGKFQSRKDKLIYFQPVFDFDKMVEEMRKAHPEYDRIKLHLSKKIFAKAMDLLSEASISSKGSGKKYILLAIIIIRIRFGHYIFKNRLKRQTSSQTSSPRRDVSMIDNADVDLCKSIMSF